MGFFKILKSIQGPLINNMKDNKEENLSNAKRAGKPERTLDDKKCQGYFWNSPNVQRF